MKFDKLTELIAKQYKAHLPFAVFSLPDSDSVSLYLQKNDTLFDTNSFVENGFIIAPFSFEDTAYIIPVQECEIWESKITLPNPELCEVILDIDIHEKNHHLDLIQNALRSIGNREQGKIVISRKKDVVLKSLDIKIVTTRLLRLDPTTFRYIWFHPKTGLWCGASPEILMKTDTVSFNTMALAGTRKYVENERSYWGEKEIDEHQIVIDSITNNLQKVTSVLKISKTYTQRAGPLQHLRTDISGTLKNGKATLQSLASAMHPTPAVCGYPIKFAKHFILENEGYDREFYTGFVGVNGLENKGSHLAVNLRCLKIRGSKAFIYVGGGITKKSDPEAEWLETENKLQPMLQVIQPFIKY